MAKSTIKILTPQQYMELRGTKNLSTIHRAIRKGWKLKGVTGVQKFGRFNLLTVAVNGKGELVDVQ